MAGDNYNFIFKFITFDPSICRRGFNFFILSSDIYHYSAALSFSHFSVYANEIFLIVEEKIDLKID